jgi:hypothetical protein
MVTNGHNARVIIPNRRPTEREDTVKQRLEGDTDATCLIDAGREVIRHWGVCDGSDGVHPLQQSHSAGKEILFPDNGEVLIMSYLLTQRCPRWVMSIGSMRVCRLVCMYGHITFRLNAMWPAYVEY